MRDIHLDPTITPTTFVATALADELRLVEQQLVEQLELSSAAEIPRERERRCRRVPDGLGLRAFAAAPAADLCVIVFWIGRPRNGSRRPR